MSHRHILDLLAYAWYSLGFVPRDSLVLVALHDPSPTPSGWALSCGALARVDLPPPRYTTTVVRHGLRPLAEQGCPAVFAVIVARRRRPALAQAVLDEARALGIEVLDVVGVGRERFKSYLCDGTCCPAKGFALDELADSRVAAELVLQGRSVADGIDDLVADVLPGPDPLPGDAPRDPWDAIDDHDELHRRRLSGLPRWGRLLRGQADRRDCPVPSADLEWLAGALTDTIFRDAVMAWLLAPAPELAEPTAREVIVGGGGAVFSVLPPERPSAAAVEPGRRILAAVARRAPEGFRAPALAVLSWLAWQGGDGVRARLLVELALGDDPDSVLARLIVRLIEEGVPPPWACLDPVAPGGVAPW